MTRPPRTMNLELAHAVLVANASVLRAEEIGIVICVAICNLEGRLVAFLRMDDASALAGHEALRRAIAAAGTGRPSEVLFDEASDEMSRTSTVQNEGIGCSRQPGGLPLWRDGEEFGAVGVCGSGSEAQDIECARAGCKVF